MGLLNTLLRRVGGVHTARYAAGKDGAGLSYEPLGRIEADDADGVVPRQAQLDEGLGDGPRVFEVLLVRPLDPLVGALHREGRLVRILVGN